MEPLAPTSVEATAEAPDPRPDWIASDALLRDEGVLFGLAHPIAGPLADTVLSEKLACIDAAFAVRKAEAAQVRAKAQARLDALEERRAELLAAREESRSPALDDAPWPRHVLGVVLAGGAAALSYAVVAELLAPARFDSPVLVAAATVAAGLSGQFATVSMLFTSDHAHLEQPGAAELWKVRLTEFALPLVAALFAVAWGASVRPLELSAVSFLMLALVFLVAGRLALSSISPLWASLRLGRARRQATLAADDERLREERVRLLVALHDGESEAAIDAECTRKRSLLLSEVALARGARATFGDAMADEARRARPSNAGVSGDGAASAAPSPPEHGDAEPYIPDPDGTGPPDIHPDDLPPL